MLWAEHATQDWIEKDSCHGLELSNPICVSAWVGKTIRYHILIAISLLKIQQFFFRYSVLVEIEFHTMTVSTVQFHVWKSIHPHFCSSLNTVAGKAIKQSEYLTQFSQGFNYISLFITILGFHAMTNYYTSDPTVSSCFSYLLSNYNLNHLSN